MDPLNEIDLEDCPVCRGAGYIEDEQGWCMLCVLPELRHGDRPRQLQDAGGAAGGRSAGCPPVEHRQGDPHRHV